MKRFMWTLGMVAITAGAALTYSPAPARALVSCEEMTCKRNNDCTPTCSGCDAVSPILGGNCEVRAEE